jgi:hypothetical protein
MSLFSPAHTVSSSRSEVTSSVVDDSSASTEASRWTVDIVKSWGPLATPAIVGGVQSDIWNSFGLKPGSGGKVDRRFENHAICLLCLDRNQLMIISRAGRQTSSMRTHKNRYHETNEEKSNRLQQKGKTQTNTIVSFFGPSEKNNFPVAKEAISRWVAITKQPFSVVEEESFRSMLLTIANNTKGFTDQHIPRKDCITDYIETKTAVIQEWMCDKLKEWNWFSVTADIWKSSNLQHFMGITVHSVNETTGNIDAIKLDVATFSGSHDAASIASFLRARLQFFSVDVRKIVMLTTDTTAAMVAAFQQSEDGSREYFDIPHFNCVAHVLDLCMKGLKEHPLTKCTIKKLLNFISMVRKSSTITRALEEACLYAGKDTKILRGFVDIRWGSVHLALQQVLLIEAEIRKIKPINKSKIQWPDDDDWIMYVGLEYILNVIHEAQQKLSAEKHVTISTIPFTLKNIEQKLNQLRAMDLFTVDADDKAAASTVIDFKLDEIPVADMNDECDEEDMGVKSAPVEIDTASYMWAPTTKLAMILKWMTEFYSLRCLGKITVLNYCST